MSGKQVLAILGSPFPNGIVAAMEQEAVCTAQRKGYHVTQVHLYKKHIGYCTGCRQCLLTGSCIQKDGIQEIADLIKRCDIVVLAAPVYWANVPAPVKNLFDRLLGTAMEDTATFPKPRLKGKKYVILTACKTPAPFSWIFGQSRGAIRCMDEFFKTAGMKPAGKVVCSNTANKRTLSKANQRRIERCFP